MTDRIKRYNEICIANHMRGDCIFPMEYLNDLAQDYTTLEILNMINFDAFEVDDKYIVGVYDENITSIADEEDANYYIDDMCEGYPFIADNLKP